MVKIIMIEDDQDTAWLLEEYLARFNMRLTNFESPGLGLDAIKTGSFDLLILDLTLPDMDGLEVCKKVKDLSDIPVIISSARNDDTDKVLGLELGADDYVAKPYNPRELVARIRAVLRRHKRDKKEETGEFELDAECMSIKKNGMVLELTPAEYEILALFLRNRGRVLSRDFIVENSKTMNWDSIDRSVDVIIGRLRKKLEDDTKNPIYIKSIRGLGYKFMR
jgi:two-component system OmpR family response regulator